MVLKRKKTCGEMNSRSPKEESEEVNMKIRGLKERNGSIMYEE